MASARIERMTLEEAPQPLSYGGQRPTYQFDHRHAKTSRGCIQVLRRRVSLNPLAIMTVAWDGSAGGTLFTLNAQRWQKRPPLP